MTKFTGPHNTPNPGKIAKVGLVFWSKKRAYHGEDVTLSVRTENVPDGTAVEITITPTGGGAVVDTVKGLSIKASQVDHKYTIKWKDKPLPKGGHGFVFRAVIGKLKSGESSVLLVDVEPPWFSA
jgi:hypothetical protein